MPETRVRISASPGADLGVGQLDGGDGEPSRLDPHGFHRPAAEPRPPAISRTAATAGRPRLRSCSRRSPRARRRPSRARAAPRPSRRRSRRSRQIESAPRQGFGHLVGRASGDDEGERRRRGARRGPGRRGGHRRPPRAPPTSLERAAVRASGAPCNGREPARRVATSGRPARAARKSTAAAAPTMPSCESVPVSSRSGDQSGAGASCGTSSDSMQRARAPQHARGGARRTCRASTPGSRSRSRRRRGRTCGAACTASTKERAPAACARPGADLRHVVDRAQGVGGRADRDELRPPNVIAASRSPSSRCRALGSHRDRADRDAPVALQRLPGVDVGVVIELRHDDLVAGPPGPSESAGEVVGERRHVLAERDLVAGIAADETRRGSPAPSASSGVGLDRASGSASACSRCA